MTAEKWILFDMDGVVTSEDGYRRATACALLDFAAYLGHPGARAAVSGPDTDGLPWKNTPDLPAHARAQNASLNTNWDQCHTAALALLLRLCEHDPANVERLARINWESDEPCEPLAWPPGLDPDAGSLMTDALAKSAGLRGFDLIEHLAGLLGNAARLGTRKGPIWQWLFRHFQCWFAGTEADMAAELHGAFFPRRRGIVHDEKLIIEPEVLAGVFRTLKDAGWNLGIATGRPRAELIPTLRRFGLLGWFDAAAITTHDEIARAEEALAAGGVTAHLSKPHPFPFLRSLMPSAPARELVFPGGLPPGGLVVVVVGDTVGDMAAAAAIGALPVGVLTGPAGVDARDVLLRAGARHVLSDVTFLPALLAEIQVAGCGL